MRIMPYNNNYFYSIAEVAYILRVSYWSVYRSLTYKKGRDPKSKNQKWKMHAINPYGRRKRIEWRIPATEVKRYLKMKGVK